MSTVYLSDILRRSGAIKADVRLDAHPISLETIPRYTLTYPGGRQTSHECAIGTRLVMPHEEHICYRDNQDRCHICGKPIPN